MENVIEETAHLIGTYVPSLIGAIAILVLGWFAALIISGIVRKLLHRTALDNQIAKWIAGDEKAKTIDIENIISKGVYYLIMLFVLVGFFQALRISLITEPINQLLNQVFSFIPQLIGAGILLLIAWIVAKLLKVLITRLLDTARVDERISSRAGTEGEPIPLSRSIADAVYWLVFLLFLPAVLGALSLEGLLDPVQGMLNKILGFLPNIITAAIIFIVGWFVARIVRQIVSNLLAAVGTDVLSERIGLTSVLGDQKLSGIIGLIVYIFIIIPISIAALNALELEAITSPASNMLNMLLAALPNIFAALLVVSVSYVIGKMVSGLVQNLLAGIGFNSILVRLGLGRESEEGKRTPSAIAGNLVFLTIIFFSVLEASRLLGFGALSELISQFMVFAGHILIGLVIFAIGLALANLASKAIAGSGTAQAGLLALTARVSIIILAGAMALRQMGLANEIINLAFGLVLGAVAIAAAIAFGIGGREIAGRELERWIQSLKGQRSQQ